MPDAESDQPYVFVSYASADRERVLPAVDRLEAAGVRSWIDREGIHGGANYAQVINDAIQNAAAFLLLASPASLASRNVKQELALGWRYEKPYVPLLLDVVTIPGELAYWLEGSQWIEILDRSEEEWLTEVAKALQPHGIEFRRSDVELRSAPTRRERPLVVGREREQAILKQHLESTVGGRGGLVLISGEAGIGKTTLVEDLCAQAEEQGALVLWGHAYDLTMTPPYGPWAEILGRADTLGEGWPSAPEFVRDAEALAKIGNQDTLVTTIIAYFRDLAARAPLVLVLDDLHWADQPSLDFLRYFARQVADHQILIMTTYRSDELNRQHPLYTLLPLLIRESNATRLAVHPLEMAGRRALIQRRYVLAEDDQARLEAYLADHAEGNPLYAEELLRALEEERVLEQGANRWTVGDLEQVHLPPMLLQVIEGRLARLDESTRQLLQVAAVIGEEVPLHLWQAASEADDERLVDAIEHAVAAHVLVEMAGGSVRFSHALFREAIYDGIVVLRQRLLHRRIAERLEDAVNSDPDRLAYHYEQAADQRAVEWWVRAAERAGRRYAWRAAAERLDAAARCQDQLGVRVVPQHHLLFESGIGLRYADPDTAVSRLNAAILEAERVGDRAVAAVARAERGFARAMLNHYQEGTAEIERAVRECDRLEEEDPGVFDRADTGLSFFGNGLRARIRSRRSSMLVFRAMAGQLADVAETGEPLRDALLSADIGSDESIVTRSDAPLVTEYSRSNTALGLAVVYTSLGRVDDAQTFYGLASRWFREAGNPWVVCQFAADELQTLALSFQTEQIDRRRYLQQLIRDTASQANEIGSATRAPLAMDYAVPLIEGDWYAARERAIDAREAYGFSAARFDANSALATLERRQGNAEAATALVLETLPNGPAAEPGDSEFVSAQTLQRIAAHIALDQGDLETARAWLEAHDRWLKWSGAVLGRADGDLIWAHYHRQKDERSLARQRAEQALRRATNPRQALALIAIHRFLGELDTDERRFDEAEEHLQESLTIADACLAPFERALTLLATAELRAAQKQPDNARELLTKVRSICEPLTAKPTLDRAAELETSLVEAAAAKSESYPAGLTAREVEVLRLIAQGMTDAQAAERLFLSPRTIGTHLSSIYGKLDVNSRSAATRFAVENGLV